MKYTTPKHIRDLVPYEPITGTYRIRLDANESYQNLQPEQVKRLQEKLLDISFNRYPDPYAKDLCKAFGDYYGVNPELVTAFDGSDEVLALMSATFYEKGQKLAAFENDFSMYRQYAETYGTECVLIPKEADLSIDVDKTLAFIQDNQVSALLFSNPCNPTSLGLKREDVIRLIEGTDALIILDEAYMDFWNQSLLDKIEDYDNLIILKTCSKAIGLAAVRVGFAVTNRKYTNILKAVKSPYNANTVSQVFAQTILQDKDYLRQAAREIVANKDVLQQGIDALAARFPVITKVYKSCTNFIYLHTTKTPEIFAKLLERSIAVRKMGEHLRINTGSAEENAVMLAELENILSGLSKEGEAE